MTSLTFLMDESVDRQIVEGVRNAGYQALYIAEMQPGLSDTEVLSLARKDNSILVTADKDFGDLVFRQKLDARGVILLRLAGLNSMKKTDVAVSAINSHAEELKHSFTVIGHSTIRIRRHIP